MIPQAITEKQKMVKNTSGAQTGSGPDITLFADTIKTVNKEI